MVVIKSYALDFNPNSMPKEFEGYAGAMIWIAAWLNRLEIGLLAYLDLAFDIFLIGQK